MASFHADKVSTFALIGVSRELGGWLDEQTVGKFHKASPEPGPSPSFADIVQMSLTAGPLAWKWSAPCKLAETFAVYTLNFDAIKEGLQTKADLFYLAKETNRWHHQITYNGQAVGYARTSSEDAAGMNVCQLYRSGLAGSINEAINWLDHFESRHPDYTASDPLVRLLFIPSYQTHAFLIIKNMSQGLVSRLASWLPGIRGINRERPPVTSDVLIIDAPTYLSPLRPLTMLTSQQLLEALHDKQPIGGGLDFKSLASG